MTKSDLPIGIFDSGVGGLTVTQEINKLLPNEKIIYFGDTQHLPYGNKSKEKIISFSKNITDFLLNKKCKVIVVACNSATANAIEEIIEKADNQAKVINVIDPVVKNVAFGFKQNIGIIATQVTVKSKVYKTKIKKLNKHIKVSEIATPLLVPVIEEGFINHKISKLVLETYLSHKKLQGIDTLILGCTHYPLIKKEVQSFYSNQVDIVDTPFIVAQSLAQYLNKHDLRSEELVGDHEFYLSDYTKKFEVLAKKIIGRNIKLYEKFL